MKWSSLLSVLSLRCKRGSSPIQLRNSYCWLSGPGRHSLCCFAFWDYIDYRYKLHRKVVFTRFGNWFCRRIRSIRPRFLWIKFSVNRFIKFCVFNSKSIFIKLGETGFIFVNRSWLSFCIRSIKSILFCIFGFKFCFGNSGCIRLSFIVFSLLRICGIWIFVFKVKYIGNRWNIWSIRFVNRRSSYSFCVIGLIKISEGNRFCFSFKSLISWSTLISCINLNKGRFKRWTLYGERSSSWTNGCMRRAIDFGWDLPKEGS